MEETYTDQPAPTAQTPEQIYLEAATLAQGLTAEELKQAVLLFESIPDYQDAAQRATAARTRYMELFQKEKAEQRSKQFAVLKKFLIIGGSILVSVALLVTVIVFVVSAVQKHNTYSEAQTLMAQARYEEAIELFQELEDYKDSRGMVLQATELRELQIKDAAYEDALKLLEAKDYPAAIEAFTQLGNHRDSPQQVEKAEELLLLQKEEEQRAKTYEAALELMNSGDDEKEGEAYALLTQLGDYKDVPQLLKQFRQVASFVEFEGGDSNYTDYTESRTFNNMGKVETILDISKPSYYSTFTKKLQYKYNSSGNQLSVTYEYVDHTPSSQNVASYEWVYDGDRLIDKRTIWIDGTVLHEYYRWYDENGNLLTPQLSDDYLISQATDAYTFTLINKTVDAKGNVLRTWSQTVQRDGTYDPESCVEETLYTYNTSGLLERVSIYSGSYAPEAVPTSESFYYYNDQNKLIQLTNGDYITDYTYDEAGNLLTLTYRHSGSVFSVYAIEYTYSWVYAPDAK